MPEITEEIREDLLLAIAALEVASLEDPGLWDRAERIRTWMDSETEEPKRYIIECPARCVDRGCTSHVGMGWRTSASVPAGMNRQQAEEFMAEHALKFYKSGPYRLREV